MIGIETETEAEKALYIRGDWSQGGSGGESGGSGSENESDDGGGGSGSSGTESGSGRSIEREGGSISVDEADSDCG